MPSIIDLSKYENVTLPTVFNQFIYLSKYARWDDNLKRRETWPECVYRYINFLVDYLKDYYNYDIPHIEQIQIFESILYLKTMPSMRCLMTAGPALLRDNAAAYNCAYAHVNSKEVFDEALYLSMCCVGFGFSVEQKFISQLPELPTKLQRGQTYRVHDSRIGWSEALRTGIDALYQGYILDMDLRDLRPAGARLKTFGGRASGPGPFCDMWNSITNIFNNNILNSRRQLDSLSCHSILCYIAKAVLAGGVRRSAMISLSDLEDDKMRYAKSGNWSEINEHFRYANNSAVYEYRPDQEQLLREYLALVEGKSGERGIFSRYAANDKIAKYGKREYIENVGVNPCGEVLMRHNGFCNLSNFIIRVNSTKNQILEGLKVSTLIGTYQSCITNFRWLNPQWRKNCEEERLLGVSLNGIFDNPFMSGYGDKKELKKFLRTCRETVVETNIKKAHEIGINESAACTLIKPEGTNSKAVGCAEGMHPYKAKYMQRNIRMNNIEPMTQFLIDQGVPNEPDQSNPQTKTIFSFLQDASHAHITEDKYSALEHLELWKIYYDEYCEHNPSITISYRENEIIPVLNFINENFDSLCGLSFIPSGNTHNYTQAPIVALTKGEFNKLKKKQPELLDFSQLSKYELEDTTTSTREFACVAGTCSLD